MSEIKKLINGLKEKIEKLENENDELNDQVFELENKIIVKDIQIKNLEDVLYSAIVEISKLKRGENNGIQKEGDETI